MSPNLLLYCISSPEAIATALQRRTRKKDEPKDRRRPEIGAEGVPFFHRFSTIYTPSTKHSYLQFIPLSGAVSLPIPSSHPRSPPPLAVFPVATDCTCCSDLVCCNLSVVTCICAWFWLVKRDKPGSAGSTVCDRPVPLCYAAKSKQILKKELVESVPTSFSARCVSVHPTHPRTYQQLSSISHSEFLILLQHHLFPLHFKTLSDRSACPPRHPCRLPLAQAILLRAQDGGRSYPHTTHQTHKWRD